MNAIDNSLYGLLGWLGKPDRSGKSLADLIAELNEVCDELIIGLAGTHPDYRRPRANLVGAIRMRLTTPKARRHYAEPFRAELARWFDIRTPRGLLPGVAEADAAAPAEFQQALNGSAEYQEDPLCQHSCRMNRATA